MPHFTAPHTGYRQAYRLSGEGPPLIFLHGWPTHSGLWSVPMEALRLHRTCIAPDWIGHGASDKPLAYGFTFAEKARELDALVAHLSAEGRIAVEAPIELVGHDIGGPVAVLWAAQNPERMRRLVLLNTIAYPFKTPLDAFSEGILHTPLLRDAFVSPFGLKMVLKTNTKSRGTETGERIQRMLAPWQTTPAALKRKALSAPLEDGRQDLLLDLADRYRSLDCKKALILAKSDGLCYAHVKRLADDNPEVPVALIPDCGHFMPIDRPEAVAKALGTALGIGIA